MSSHSSGMLQLPGNTEDLISIPNIESFKNLYIAIESGLALTDWDFLEKAPQPYLQGFFIEKTFVNSFLKEV